MYESDIEYLYGMQRQIVHVEPKTDKVKTCLELAYSSISQVIKALEQLEDLLESDEVSSD